jgi:plasmid stabilization system protein ParE
MALIRWTGQAIFDIEDIAAFISKDSQRYAALTVRNIFNAVIVLQDFPLFGRVVPEFSDERIREIIHGRFRIVYLLKDTDSIDVLTIHHSARLLTDSSINTG